MPTFLVRQEKKKTLAFTILEKAPQYMTLMFSPDPNSSEMRIFSVICSRPFRP